MIKPIYEYSLTEKEDNTRILSYKGRDGINTTSIHKKITVPKHTVNNSEGSLTIWLLPLEDLATVSHQEHFMDVDPLYQNYAILSDNINSKAYNESVFCVNWMSNWYPQLFAKCFEGYIYSDSPTNKPYLSATPIKSAFAIDVKGHKAFTAAGRFFFKKAHWYQVSVTWDKVKNIFNIYINGVLVSCANSGVRMQWEKCGDVLYAGNPSFALSELKFYDKCLTNDLICEAFEAETKEPDDELLKELRKQYLADGIEMLDFKPDDNWELKLDLSFKKPEHLNEFYVQGNTDSPHITDEGLLINTTNNEIPLYDEDGERMDKNNMYLWSEKSFEGDLYAEFEFMPKVHNGFGIAIFQASGLQREDFMNDYKRRKTGTMSMLLWENVRSYSWGFFREMDDVRDDVETHIFMKNPWIRPLGFQCGAKRMELNKWYKAQFIQEGNHIRAILNGRVLLDVYDDSFTNSGPVLGGGHFALRCMKRTQMMFRNLKIYNKKMFFEVKE